MIKRFLTIASLLLCVSLAGFGQVKKVAVYITGECEPGIAEILKDQLCEAFTSSKTLKAIERNDDFLAEINRELNFQRSGSVADKLIAKLGERYGADYVCVSKITTAFGEKYIAARLVNTNTSEIDAQANTTSNLNSMNELKNVCDTLKDKLTKKIAGLNKSTQTPITKPAQTVTPKPAEKISQIAQSGFVDLGLSVLWAACNIGATKPEDCGNYYAWGETRSKSEYTEKNCKIYKWNRTGLYNDEDVARRYAKGRMPTSKEMLELAYKCTWTPTEINQIKGMKVTGPNGNSIFLPCSGYHWKSSFSGEGSFGRYWSRTSESEKEWANALAFRSDMKGAECTKELRYYGFTVRPVMSK